MCRCSLADAFSQVPLYLRQTITSVTTIPKDQPSAYTVGQQITLFSKVDPDVLVHESSHAQVIFLTRVLYLSVHQRSISCQRGSAHCAHALSVRLRALRPINAGLVCRMAGSPALLHGSR